MASGGLNRHRGSTFRLSPRLPSPEGANTGDSFGYRAVPAGDFDGDGRADIAVSAPGMDAGGDQSGSVVLLPVPL